MTTQQDSQKGNSEDHSSSPASVPLNRGGEVVVTYLDSPPLADKKSIHPRRQAPQVPDQDDGTRAKS
jgi:hypothetical protein